MVRPLIPRWSLMLALIALSGAAAWGDESADDWKHAISCFNKADYSGAVRALDAVIARQPTPPAVELPAPLGRLGSVIKLPPVKINPTTIYTLRAEAQLNQGQWDLGLADCERAEALGATDPNLLRIKGYCQLGRQDLDLARATFSAAITRAPKEIYSYYGRAATNLMVKRYDEALADLSALWSRTRSAPVLQLRGMVHVCRRDYSLALADWDQAIRLAPRDAMNWSNRASIQLLADRVEDAAHDAEEAVRLDPKRGLAWNTLGAVNLRQKQYDAAIRATTEAIRLEPAEAGNYLKNLAVARWRLNDAPGALADIDRSVAAGSADPQLDAFRASILATTPDDSLRDPQRALTLATHAVEATQRRAPYPLEALAEAYAALGDFPHAIETAELALQIPPPDPIEWQISAVQSNQFSLGFWIKSLDPERSRRELTADLALYRLGKPCRHH